MCFFPARSNHGRLSFLLLASIFVGPATPLDAQTITVTAPNGGEVWEAGTPQLITWESTDLDGFVEICLLRDGELRESIGVTMVWEGWFEWTICEFVGDSANYTVRIASLGIDPPIEDVSDGPFEVFGSTPVPTLAITSPVGGEAWSAGTTQMVAWDCTDPSGYVEARLFRGDEHNAFIGHVPMEDGGIIWDICPFIGDGGDYSVRLTWLDHCGPDVQDFSPAPFTITGSRPLPTLTVTSPNGGEVWPADTIQTVTWDSTDPSGDVDIWLIDSETRYDFLGSVATIDGEFDWPILPCVDDANDLSIVVRWSTRDRSVEDVSDAPFEITGSTTPELTVTSPAEGEEWTAGTTQRITWTSSCTNGDVEIELYNRIRLGRVPVSDGSFEWDICPGVGDSSSHRIRLCMPECAAEATSDHFRISGSATPTLTLTSPVGGETWAAGSPQEITWESTNLTGYLDIYVPNDGEYHSGYVAVPVAEGSFTWPIAPTLSPGDHGGVWIISRDCGPIVSVFGDAFEITERVTPLGDLDADNDIDMRDIASFQRCFTGRGPVILDPVCDSFDFEPDGDVDIDEFAELAESMTGP
jgi:hypothetical protein